MGTDIRRAFDVNRLATILGVPIGTIRMDDEVTFARSLRQALQYRRRAADLRAKALAFSGRAKRPSATAPEPAPTMRFSRHDAEQPKRKLFGAASALAAHKRRLAAHS